MFGRKKKRSSSVGSERSDSVYYCKMHKTFHPVSGGQCGTAQNQQSPARTVGSMAVQNNGDLQTVQAQVHSSSTDAPNAREEDYICGLNLHWARSQVRTKGSQSLKNYLIIGGYDDGAIDRIMEAACREVEDKDTGYICGLKVATIRAQVRDLGPEAFKNYLEIAGYDDETIYKIMEEATPRERKQINVSSQDFPRLKADLLNEVEKLVTEYNSKLQGNDQYALKLDPIQDLMKALKRKRQKLDRVVNHLIANEGNIDFYSKERKSFHEDVKRPWDHLNSRRKVLGVDDGSSFYSSVSASPSNSSGASETERRLAEAEAERFKAEEMMEVKEQEIDLKSQLQKNQLKMEQIDKAAKVKYLEQLLAAERNSLAGSQVSDWINNSPGGVDNTKLPEISEKIREFGPDATRNWLRLSGKTDAQVEEVFKRLGYGLGQPGLQRSPILTNKFFKTYGKPEEKSVAREEDGLWPGSTVTWKPASSNDHRFTSQQMDSTAKFLLRKDLLTPNQGADIFKDDRTKFLSWINRLMKECNELNLPAADRIRVLRSRTEGKARKVIDLVDDCSHGAPEKALEEVMKKLYKRFGCGPEIADDVRKRIDNLTPIKASDNPEKIQELADFTTRIVFIMNQVPELADLNTANGVSKIRKNLPLDLQRRWVTAGTKYKERSPNEEHPPFTYFSEWLNNEADKLCDPHFKIDYLQNKKDHKDQKKDKAKPTKVLKTEKRETEGKGQKAPKTEKSEANMTTNKQGELVKTGQGNCIFHPKGVHSLKDCMLLQSMPEKDRDILTKRVAGLPGKPDASSKQ